jgi:hypothetical protein
MADKLTDAKRKELDDYYQKKRDNLPVCSTCNTNNDVIPTVRGKPSPDCKKCQQFL